MHKLIIFIFLLSITGCLSHKKGLVNWTNPSINQDQIPGITYQPLNFPNYYYSLSIGHNSGVIQPIELFGQLDDCSVSPTLPSGLILNTSSCSIQGIPTAISSSTSYTIKIKVGSKIYVNSITIEVLGIACTSGSATGTSTTPLLYNGKYIICNSQQLLSFANNPIGSVGSIQADINIGNRVAPIGSLDGLSLEGNGHKIFGSILDNNDSDVGLFAKISSSNISNLMIDLIVSGTNRVGLLASGIKDSNLVNILVMPTATVSGGSNCTGLLFGEYLGGINFMSYTNVILFGKINSNAANISGVVACIPGSYSSVLSLDFNNSYYAADLINSTVKNLGSIGRPAALLQDGSSLVLDSNYWDQSINTIPTLKPTPGLTVSF